MDPFTASVLLLTEIVKAYNNESPATRNAQGLEWQANLDGLVAAANLGLKLLNIPLVIPRIVVYIAPATAAKVGEPPTTNQPHETRT